MHDSYKGFLARHRREAYVNLSHNAIPRTRAALARNRLLENYHQYVFEISLFTRRCALAAKLLFSTLMPYLFRRARAALAITAAKSSECENWQH
jgi:hypothetical protein